MSETEADVGADGALGKVARFTSRLSPWRTAGVATIVVLAQTAAFFFMVRHDPGATANAQIAFGALCLWNAAIVTSVAAKAGIEHLAGNGGGIKGAVAALMTDAKPGDAVTPKAP